MSDLYLYIYDISKGMAKQVRNKIFQNLNSNQLNIYNSLVRCFWVTITIAWFNMETISTLHFEWFSGKTIDGIWHTGIVAFGDEWYIINEKKIKEY